MSMRAEGGERSTYDDDVSGARAERRASRRFRSIRMMRRLVLVLFWRLIDALFSIARGNLSLPKKASATRRKFSHSKTNEKISRIRLFSRVQQLPLTLMIFLSVTARTKIFFVILTVNSVLQIFSLHH